MLNEFKKYIRPSIIIMTGGINEETLFETINFFNEINSLKKEKLIIDIYIENHISLKNSLDKNLIVDNKIKFIDNIIHSDISRISEKDYLNKISYLKKSKRKQIINQVLSDHPEKDDLYILFIRNDVTLERDFIEEYIFTKPIANKLLKDKIWVSSADLVKPFYINDMFIFGHIKDILKLTNTEIITQKNYYGFQHQREFIGIFIEKYSIFKEMIENKYGFNSNLYTRENRSAPDIVEFINSSFWTKSLVILYQYILKNYFNIKGERFYWLDASGNDRHGKFFNKEYLFNQGLDILSNVKRNIKYDGTLYIYENLKNNKLHIDALLNHREKFALFIKFLNYENINYLIIRGYRNLPLSPDTDIDIVYHHDNEDKFLEIVNLFWDINKETITNNIFNYSCKYTQWWTSGEPDESIANERFTMDTYNHFFFHLDKKFCLDINQENDIFLKKIRTQQDFFIPCPEHEILLLGYRSYYDLNKSFKEKHLNIIFEILRENNLKLDDLRKIVSNQTDQKILNYIEESYEYFFNEIKIIEI